MDETRYSQLVKMLFIPLLEKINFSPDRDQLNWYRENVEADIVGIGHRDVYLAYTRWPNQGFDHNFQRDKFLSDRDELLAVYEGHLMTPILSRKRHSKEVTLYKKNIQLDVDKLKKAFEERNYIVQIKDAYHDDKVDLADGRSGGNHYNAVHEES